MRLSLIGALAVLILLCDPTHAQPPPPAPGPNGAITIQQPLLGGLVPSSVGGPLDEPLFMNNQGEFVPIAAMRRYHPSHASNAMDFSGTTHQRCYWVALKLYRQINEIVTLGCENRLGAIVGFPTI